MTLETTITKKSYDGDDSTVAFPTTFIFWDITDIEVILTDALGVEQPPWVEGTQYDLAGGDGELGTVTVKTTPTDYTPATGEKLLIRSNRDDIQDDALPLGGAFPSVTVEQSLDQLTRLIQQRTEELSRVLTVKKTSELDGIEVPDPVTGQILIGNAAGDGYDNAEPLEGSVILDEDDMASNSPTQAASQQSIVAYVNYDTGTLTPGGDYTGGTIRWVRMFKLVTISFENLTHAGDSAPVAPGGTIPDAIQPNVDTQNAYSVSAAAIKNVTITQGGAFITEYFNHAGVPLALSGSLSGSISYIID